MSKKTKRVPKRGAVWHLSAEEATLSHKPRYNGFACGHGAHGDAKYNRARANRAWKRDMQKGPHGPFFVSSEIQLETMPLVCEWFYLAEVPLPASYLRGVLARTSSMASLPVRCSILSSNIRSVFQKASISLSSASWGMAGA